MEAVSETRTSILGDFFRRRLERWRWHRSREGFRDLARRTWVLGVAVPVLGLCAAWIVLDSFDPLRVFVYGYSAILLVVLVLWLLRRGELGVWSALIGGVFSGGTLFAAAMAILLLPLTATAAMGICLLPVTIAFGGPLFALAAVVLVLFGLAPFAWTLILLAQASQARLRTPPTPWWLALWFWGLVLPFLLAAAAQVGAYRIEAGLKDEIARGSGPALEIPLERLVRWHRVLGTDLLFIEYDRRRESDVDGAQRVARAYLRCTGKSLADSPDESGPLQAEFRTLTGWVSPRNLAYRWRPRDSND
jgi:hypothetical protein